MKKVYVTFQIKKVVSIDNSFVPTFKTFKYAIICDNMTEAIDIASDIYSIDGVKYVNFNKCGKFKKGIEIIDKNDYQKKF